MAQTPSQGDTIEQLIREDLDHLAMYAGLKDPRFGGTQLIREGKLPGNHRQQVILFEKLILNNIKNVEPEETREALEVKLNLRDGYPDSSSEKRLGVLGRSRGLQVPDGGNERGDSRQTRIIATKGRNQLAACIRKEIDERNEDNSWDTLLEGSAQVFRRGASSEPLPGGSQQDPTHRGLTALGQVEVEEKSSIRVDRIEVTLTLNNAGKVTQALHSYTITALEDKTDQFATEVINKDGSTEERFGKRWLFVREHPLSEQSLVPIVGCNVVWRATLLARHDAQEVYFEKLSPVPVESTLDDVLRQNRLIEKQATASNPPFYDIYLNEFLAVPMLQGRQSYTFAYRLEGGIEPRRIVSLPGGLQCTFVYFTRDHGNAYSYFAIAPLGDVSTLAIRFEPSGEIQSASFADVDDDLQVADEYYVIRVLPATHAEWIEPNPDGSHHFNISKPASGKYAGIFWESLP